MNREFSKWAIIALICFSFLSTAHTLGFFSSINSGLADKLYGDIMPMNNIVIVAIDDESIQKIGRWPWGRGNFTLLVEKLSSARVVGIDVAFFENSNFNDDSRLADAVAEHKNIVLNAEYTEFRKENGNLAGEKIMLPVAGMAARATLGYVNIVTDADGVTRSANLNIIGNYSSFAQAIYEKYLGKQFTDKSSRFMINFVGSPKSYKYYSFVDVLQSNYSFKDKIVLVGATSPDLHDDYFVPTSKGKAMPGVEVHANTIQTMISRKYLNDEPVWLILLIIAAFAAITSYVTNKFKIIHSSLTGVALFAASILISIAAFNFGFIPNIVYPILTIFITYSVSIAYRYLHEEKQKKHIQQAFSKYVSPILVNEIVKHPDKLKLGGEKREITIMFSDIRKFTTLSEALGPEKLVSFLNEYLTEMTNIILKNKGLVDKYIGDAIMAFWGAPLDEKEKERLACKTSVEMIVKLQELRKKWKHLPAIDIGIGLNDGGCIVGNMGSHERFDYTAIGDSVNLASRLEGLNKQYGTEIIVSESVYEKVKKDFVFKELDYVKVKGKKKPVKIYELIATNIDEKKKEEITRFEKGFSLYLNKDFDAAIKEFSKLDDKASKVFIKRSHSLKKECPKNWDGSYEHTSK